MARWLVQVGRVEEAKKVLGRLRRKGDAVDQVKPKDLSKKLPGAIQELQEIEDMVAEDRKIQTITEGSAFRYMALMPIPCMTCRMVFLVSRACKDSNVRKALLVGCSLQLFQQLIGINTVKLFKLFITVIHCSQVIYYSARILMMSGISRDMTMILWLSALVSAVNFFASFLGTCPHSHSVLETLFIFAGMALIDRLGRRVLCLGSYLGILASLLVIGAGFQLSEYRKLIMKLCLTKPLNYFYNKDDMVSQA